VGGGEQNATAAAGDVEPVDGGETLTDAGACRK